MAPATLHLIGWLAAGAAIGLAASATRTGSLLLMAAAGVAAIVFALVQSLAMQREAGERFERLLAELRSLNCRDGR